MVTETHIHNEAVSPIFYYDSSGDRVVDGNGFVVKYESRFFFVTCHHVIMRELNEYFIELNGLRLPLSMRDKRYYGKYVPIDGRGSNNNNNQIPIDFGILPLPSYDGSFLTLAEAKSIDVHTSLLIITHSAEGNQFPKKSKILNSNSEMRIIFEGRKLTVPGAVALKESSDYPSKIAKGDSGGPVLIKESSQCVGILKAGVCTQVIGGFPKQIPYMLTSEGLISFISENFM
jgi:hypothetical protein